MPALHDETSARRGHQAAQELHWLQSLARRVALNRDEADDLAQETWLAAEQSETTPTRSRRAWLHGVLRNRERVRRRGLARRRTREDRAATVADGARDLDADAELHRQRVLSGVREALDELGESDRQLLLACYCDEHPASDMARRLGIPASTVRSRLSRATARVRRSLDERWGGDREAWAPAVLAMPRSARPASPAPLGWKALLVAMMGKKIIVGLVAIVAAFGLWAATRTADTKDTEDSADVVVDESAQLAAKKYAQRAQNPPDGRSGRLVGEVVDAETGQPVGNAVVLVAREAGAAMVRRGSGGPPTVPWARADSVGKFAVADVPAGQYRVSATAPGYLPVQHHNIEVAPTRDSAAVVLRLQAGGNLIEGTLTDIGGGVVEGALVRAQQTNGWGTIGMNNATVSDAEGHYRMTVPDGGWRITAGGVDYTAASRNIEVRQGPGRADFALIPGGTIHGRVLSNLTRKPVADATVGFTHYVQRDGGFSSDTSEPEARAVTDSEGRFRLGPLAPGEYSLTGTARSLASSVSPRVHVALAEEVTDIEVLVDPAFNARGFVVEEANPEHGFGGVRVSAMRMTKPEPVVAVTEPDGYFELHGLTTGSYVLVLEGENILPTGMEQSIQIEDRDLEDTIVAVGRGTTVEGRVDPPVVGSVKVTLNEKVHGFGGMLDRVKLQNAYARIDAGGTFTIDAVPEGSWNLVATGEDGSLGELKIEVPPEGLSGVSISMAPRPKVAGQLTDASGAPLVGLTVELSQPTAPDHPLRRTRPRVVAHRPVTAADGSFVAWGVEPGHYDLVVRDPSGQVAKIIEGPQALDATEGHNVEDLRLRVALPSGRLTGLVAGPQGEPVADAWVTLRSTAVDADRSIRAKSTSVVTDEVGRFEFEGLADTSYSVHVRGPDANTRGSAEDVQIGTDLRITLEAMGQIRGVVTQDGTPVTRFSVESGFGRRAQTIVAPDGSFVLARIRPGTRRITVTTETGSASAEVEIAAGATVDVELAIDPWATLEGIVVSSEDGEPLAGIDFRVNIDGGEKPRELNIASMLAGGTGNTTDSEGRFSYEGLGAGHGTIHFRAKGMGRRTVPLGAHEFTMTGSGSLDLGTVAVLPPVEIPEDEQGSLGLRTAARGASPTGGSNPRSPATAGAVLETKELHLWIVDVTPEGAAETAGVAIGDKVLAVDGVAASEVGPHRIGALLSSQRARKGQRLVLTIDRDGQARTVTVQAK